MGEELSSTRLSDSPRPWARIDNPLPPSVRQTQCHPPALNPTLPHARTSPQITVCDISERMLGVGRERAARLGGGGVEWVCADAQTLPFPSGRFDAYTIAYGMRNVVDVDQVSSPATRHPQSSWRSAVSVRDPRSMPVRAGYDLSAGQKAEFKSLERFYKDRRNVRS